MPSLPALFDANGSFGKPAAATPDCATAATRVAHMDRLGIGRALTWNVEATQLQSLAANRRLLDEIARTPGAAGRLIPALIVSGLIAYERGGIERLAAQMEEGRTRALRFVNVGGRLTLEQCAPVVRAVRRLKPFFLVKWGEAPARDLLDFAAAFPGVPIVLTDLIWPNAIGAFDLMRQRSNVLMETSWWHTADGVALAAKHFGAERVLFGTGYRSHNGAAIAALARAEICPRATRADRPRQPGSSHRPATDARRGRGRAGQSPVAEVPGGRTAGRGHRGRARTPGAIRQATCSNTRRSASRFPTSCARWTGSASAA